VVAIAIYEFTVAMGIFFKLFESLPKTIYFWLPVMAIFLGYGFLGRLLRVLTISGINPITTVLLALCIGSVWALTLGYGGLLATALTLGIVFMYGGVGSGFIAIATAAVTMWLGFAQTDQERSQDQKITILEIGSVVVFLSLAVLITMAIYDALSGMTADVVMGVIAGGYTVIGSQIKASGIDRKQAFNFFALLVGLGLAIGWVYGWFTYKVFIPS
jgi:hypothetical protein